ncbi:sigma factor-like helix-turn-helix DNA-binding protein [Paenibacillus sp. FSL H7-0918]|uniref:sigma factor-like helix-turn-helix DNA-binding protein n=1 Tax=unclassified Paenibacillus TaxID=185978 RepID=UPI00404691D2
MIILEKLSTGDAPDESNTRSLQIALKRYCLALTQSPWDADDLAQDTWVKALGYMKTSDSTSANNGNSPMNEVKQNKETIENDKANGANGANGANQKLETNQTNQMNYMVSTAAKAVTPSKTATSANSATSAKAVTPSKTAPSTKSAMHSTIPTNSTHHTRSTNHPNPEALLFRIARNTWIDIMRRKATLSRVLELDQSPTEASAEYGSFEIEAAFQALQGHLSPLQQAVFLLRDVLGHSAMEAADILDTTEGAIKAALHRARQALPLVRQELLQADGPSLPQDTAMQIVLSRLAAAYEHGEIDELIELVFADESQEPVMAVSSQSLQGFQTFQAGGFSSNSWNYTTPGMCMVA